MDLVSVWNGCADREHARAGQRSAPVLQVRVHRYPKITTHGVWVRVQDYIARQAPPFTSAQMALELDINADQAAAYLSQAYRRALVTRTSTPCRRACANGHTFPLVARVYRTVRA